MRTDHCCRQGGAREVKGEACLDGLVSARAEGEASALHIAGHLGFFDVP